MVTPEIKSLIYLDFLLIWFYCLMHAEKIAIGKFDYTRKLQLLFMYKQGTFASKPYWKSDAATVVQYIQCYLENDKVHM